MTTSITTAEIATQPALWGRALGLDVAGALPAPGERVAVVGCGTSWFMAQVYAQRREALGQGRTDAFTATEFPTGRDYDRVVALTRSGTTTEIVDLLSALATPSVVVTAVEDSPAARAATATVALPFADERSVVQTRFATTALVVLLRSAGHRLDDAVPDATTALAHTLDAAWIDAPQITFLGLDWTVGLAHEAALKLREAAQSWTESYSAMEYRHGPIAIAEPSRLVWTLSPPPEGLDEQVAATGATLVDLDLDPLARLVVAQRLAVARAEARGLDPDQPRSLTRSVILSSS